MKTLSYVLGREREIEIGQEYYFGHLCGVTNGAKTARRTTVILQITQM